MLPQLIHHTSRRCPSECCVAVMIQLALVCVLCGPSSAIASTDPTYRDVALLLKERCVVCHNRTTQGDAAISGGLSLESYAAIKAGMKGLKALLIPGKSSQSELVRRMLSSSPTRLMPKGGPPLHSDQILLFRRWIDAGIPEGAPLKETRKSVDPAALPLPANPQSLWVTLPTGIQAGTNAKPSRPSPPVVLTARLRIGPLPPVTALAFSPNGKLLAVGSYRSIMLWDTATGLPRGCFTHLSGQVKALAFHPKGTLIAAASGTPGLSGDVRVFDAQTLAADGPLLSGHQDEILSMAWDRDGSRLATASQDHTARLWEWPSGKLLNTFREHGDAVTRICFAPDGKSLYTASLDHNLRRFDAADGHKIRLYSGHSDGVTALAVSPKGDNLVSAGVEPQIRWWNAETGDSTSRQDGHSGPVNDLVFSQEGRILASASADHSVRLWDGGNGSQLRSLDGSPDWVYASAIRPDGKLIAGAGADGVTRLWEAATGRLRLSLIFWPPSSQPAPFNWLALTPEGYFDGSDEWTSRLAWQSNGKSVASPDQNRFLAQLKQKDQVARAWQNADLAAVVIRANAVVPSAISPIKTDAKTPGKGQ